MTTNESECEREIAGGSQSRTTSVSAVNIGQLCPNAHSRVLHTWRFDLWRVSAFWQIDQQPNDSFATLERVINWSEYHQMRSMVDRSERRNTNYNPPRFYGIGYILLGICLPYNVSGRSRRKSLQPYASAYLARHCYMRSFFFLHARKGGCTLTTIAILCRTQSTSFAAQSNVGNPRL